MESDIPNPNISALFQILFFDFESCKKMSDSEEPCCSKRIKFDEEAHKCAGSTISEDPRGISPDIFAGSSQNVNPGEQKTGTEQINAESAFGHYVWPCAIRLAEWIYANPGSFENKVVLELGCGVGLSGIAAAKCGAKKVIFTDKAGNTESIRLAKKNCSANNVASEKIDFGNISWGLVEPFLATMVGIDILLISDGFYDPSIFQDLIFTIKFILDQNPGCVCIFSYQIRSADWSIERILKIYNLVCNVLYFDGGNTNVRIQGGKSSDDHSIVVAEIKVC